MFPWLNSLFAVRGARAVDNIKNKVTAPIGALESALLLAGAATLVFLALRKGRL